MLGQHHHTCDVIFISFLVLNIHITMSARNGPRNAGIVYDDEGYEYRQKSRQSGRSTYVCCQTNLPFICTGKAQVSNNEEIVCTMAHNHPPSEHGRAIREFRIRLWQEVMTTEDSFRTIYLRVALECAEAASRLPFSKLERSMRRWRYIPHPPIPRTLFEYGRFINMPAWESYRTYPQGRLEVKTFIIDSRTSIAIMGDRQFLATLGGIEIFHADATFSVCPRTPPKLQLLTIMGKIDAIRIPLAWIFMTRKTGVAYKKAFAMFRNLAPHLHPTVVHMDFEAAMRNAFLEVYPDVMIIHCYFHHTQAIYKKLKSVRNSVDVLCRWDLAKVFYRKLITIALLPPNDINEAFQWLTANTPPDLWTLFEDLFDYYADTWLRHYTPERFTVYRLNERTNNHIEAYHHVLSDQLGEHPDIWKFMKKILRVQSITRIEVNSLNRGLQVRRTVTRRYRNREIVLNHLWDLYENGRLNYVRFLACTNHISEAFNNNMIITTPDDVDIFLTAPVHDITLQPPNFAMRDMIFEGFNEGDPIPILEVNPVVGANLFIFQSLNQSLCPGCHRAILNVITLPCQHWFRCRTCTQAKAVEEAEHQRVPVCLICQHECIAFQVVQIS